MDTYTITFTNGNTTTFTVTNGNDGEKGDKGDKGDKGNTGNTGATGNGISTVAKTGTSGLVDTYTITFTNGNTTTFTVTNGADGSVPIVTSWESTLSDSKVPSEKLTKNALDGKQATLISGTSIKTINNTSLLGSGNIDVAPPFDITTSWGNPTSDSKVPSEKLTKSSLDNKLDNTIGSSAVTIASDDNIVITDTSDSNKVKKVANLLASQVKDSTAHSNIGSSANDTQATINSDIDTALSNKVSMSSTVGLLKNDGSVMASGTGSSNWAVGNHTHSAYVNPTKVTSWSSTPSDDNVASEKLIKNSLDGKLDNSNSSTTVTIASEDKILITDYSDSNKIKRADNILASQVKDGSAHSNIGSSASATQGTINANIDTVLGNKVSKSSTSGLLKNDGSVDTNAYITSSALPIIQTIWGNPTSDSKVASEKLIKDSLDGKLDNTIGSSAVTIASDDNILITDTSDNSKVKKVANILASQVKDSSAHSNIGSSANDPQSTINTKIDTELANRLSMQQGNTHRNMNVVTDDLGNITFEAKATVENVNRKMDKFYFKTQDFITPSEWYFDYTYYDVIPTVNNSVLNLTSRGNYLFIFNDSDGNWVEQSRHLLPPNYTLSFTVTSTNSNSELHIGGIYSSGNLVNVLDGSSNCIIEIECVNGVATVTNSDTQNSWSTDYGWYVDSIKFVEVVNIGTIAISNFGYAPYTSMELIPSKALIEDNELSNINTGMGATQSAINSAINTALGDKQATLVSGTSIKTINNESLLGSGNITIQGGSSVDIVTAWESTPSDSKVASEKLTKDTLDTKIAKSSTSGLVKNDGTIDTSSYITSSAISGMLTSSDIADNLTTNDATKVLSAKQGKALKDLIGDAITYINGSGS